MDGTLSMGAMVGILVLYLLIALGVLYMELQSNVMASPVTTYECVVQRPKKEELETSSSEIRIESDDETAEVNEVGDEKIVSTLAHRHDSMDSEMEGNAGLEI